MVEFLINSWWLHFYANPWITLFYTGMGWALLAAITVLTKQAIDDIWR